ncbi:MAG TPA: molybdate ABC transporter substrate-binding protein [Mycobacteriales bacterium]|nr:molybdate ABC transporter substrate-binding protein [Mycobacteriales bacterium]
MRARRGALVATVLVAAAACSGAGASGGSGQRARVTVFAASSLTDAFTAIGKTYDAVHRSSTTFSFAGSQDLVAQIGNGAPADVVATADAATMAKIADELVSRAHVLARNRLVIVTQPGNPHHVHALSDLAAPGLTLVLADPSVPAGTYAAAALRSAAVTVHPASLELDVRAVLTKVELGEADAGVVYATDAASAGRRVSSVPIADAPVATYEIGALDGKGSDFVDYALSAAGQRELRRRGFLPP